MKRHFLELGAILVIAFIFAFIFNFLWESFHAVYLYKNHNMEASHYIPMIVYVSTIDSLFIIGLYMATGIVWRNILWIKEFILYQWLLFTASGILLAGVIEYRAVYSTDRWSYMPYMPTLFGLGLSPLVQLSLTGLVTILLVKEILYGKGLLRK
jgi:hypothetical protein